VRIHRYGLVRDSGGAGKYRGGLAIEREWELLTGEAHLAIRSDRRDHLPYGLYGGCSGTGSINVLQHVDATADGGRQTAEILPTMISTSMSAGERIYHRMAGGGGHGDPWLRDPSLVARDVKNDKVSLHAAREQYGVVINEATGEVDTERTAEIRKQIKDDFD